MSKTDAPITAKKSHKDGHVSVGVRLKCRGWHGGDASVRLEGSTDITSIQARELARALIEQADKADAKVAAKIKHEENRQKWRDLEIAAGRMVVMGGPR